MVGSAVPTMVWSKAASSMPSTMVPKTTFRCRTSSTGGAEGWASVATVMPPASGPYGPVAIRFGRSGEGRGRCAFARARVAAPGAAGDDGPELGRVLRIPAQFAGPRTPGRGS